MMTEYASEDLLTSIKTLNIFFVTKVLLISNDSVTSVLSVMYCAILPDSLSSYEKLICHDLYGQFNSHISILTWHYRGNGI